MTLTVNGQSKFKKATLSDGTVLERVWLTRATGYDTSIWVTDGTTYAHIMHVVKLEGPSGTHG